MPSEHQHTIDDHFADKDAKLRKTYDKVVASASKFGPVGQEAKKTSIHLVNKTAFAGVSARKDHILLNIKSDSPLVSPRFAKSEKLSSRRYHQELRLGSPQEVDKELIEWLKTAYELSA